MFWKRFDSTLPAAKAVVCGIVLLTLASALHASAPSVQSGGYFTSAADLARLRAQAADPRLAGAYLQVHTESESAITRWEQSFPAGKPAPSTEALMAFGQGKDARDTAYTSVVIDCALHPAERCKRVVREMAMADLGWRQRRNYWHGMGIHDGIATTDFLETYDIGAQLGAFTAADHAAIREVMHQAGHFFEGWLLDNSFSRMYEDKREEDYCLNFHVFSAASLSWIAMLYPDFPESKEWLRESESSLVTYLMNGFAEDGGYSEGSVLYWRHSVHALTDFFVVSRNLGVADYLSIPAIADRLRETLHWRLDLTAPDGNVFAIGDSERTGGGHTMLFTGGRLLDDQEVLWGARVGFERGNHFSLDDMGALFLAHLDMKLAGTEPGHVSALYPFSGFATFRSDWGAKGDALFFKFGTSFVGRREAEKNPVISGHSHQDALEFDLHYRGVPVVADWGRHGKYETWASYGGYSKATVAHSAVGLGNVWGYDRLDGKYAQHQAERGPDFTYERTQQDIGRADTQLMAYGDVRHAAFSSAKVKTYEDVTQQRSLIWFPDDSLTIVHDHMESKEEQPYEWYLNPAGDPIAKTGRLVFGTPTTKIEVLPVLPADVRVTTISKSTANLPPYYTGWTEAKQDATDAKPGFSLLILQKKAKSTDFLNVLMPFSGEENVWKTEAMGSAGRRLIAGDKEVLVAGAGVSGGLMTKGSCGVVERAGGSDRIFALVEGETLQHDGKTLVSSVLQTPVWRERFSPKLNALVSLTDKRAVFDLKPWPLDAGMLLNPPLLKPGEEPTALLLVAVSFRVDSSPKKMMVMHSFNEELKLDDPAWDKKTDWPRDRHVPLYKRQPLEFTYDAAAGTVTVLLEPGEHQVVWQ